MRPKDLLVLLPLLIAGLLLSGPAQSAALRNPNIVFILADDLGVGDLGCYGQQKIRTPNLDHMAAEGLRFTQFYSGSPVCAPSRCTFMTGKHSGHGWVRDNREVQPEGQAPIPADSVTIARVLKARGYATGAMGKWGLGPPDSEGDPNRQGFDLFFGYNCQRQAHNHYPTFLRRNDQVLKLEGNTGGATGKQFSHDLMEAETLRFIRDHRQDPFFLYVPFTVPHLALQVPEDSLAEYLGKWDDPPYTGGNGYLPHPHPRAAYAAMVTRLDRSVGRILALLKELKLEEDTLVVFASDNGPTYDRLGGSDSEFFNSAGGLRGLKGDVYEGGIRVPLIARWPGKIRPGRTSGVPAALWDLFPTFCEVSGSAPPRDLDGVSLLPTLLDRKEQARHPYLYWEFASYGGQQAVRLGDWKGVRRDMRKGNMRLELYNLAQDPAEKHDLAGERLELVQRIEGIMKEAHTPSALFPLPGVDAPARPGKASR